MFIFQILGDLALLVGYVSFMLRIWKMGAKYLKLPRWLATHPKHEPSNSQNLRKQLDIFFTEVQLEIGDIVSSREMVTLPDELLVALYRVDQELANASDRARESILGAEKS